MNKHYFKRILESIITRRKDSLLIFFIIFILSFFIIVSTCISRLGSNISNDILTSMDMNLYIKDCEIKKMNTTGFGALVNKTLVNIEDNIKELAKNEDVTYEFVYSKRLSTNFDYAYNDEEYVNHFGGYYENNIYSAASLEAFESDDLSIAKGRYFDEDEDKAAIILNSTYINNKEADVGDTLSIKINNRTYEYTIVGLFNITYSSDVIENKTYYENPTVILSKNSMLELCNDANIAPIISRINLSFKNGYRLETIESEFRQCINDAIKTSRLNGRLINDSIESNYDDYEKLIAPSKNMSTLYSIISIIISFISCLLLINIVIYLNDKRLKEYAILQSLGQSKLLSIISFAIEILIIANIAITIALPIGIKVARISSDNLINENLKIQDRLAYITNNQEDIDIFKQQNEIYSNYKISVDNKDILMVYGLNNGLVLLSCLYVFIAISKTKPRILISK